MSPIVPERPPAMWARRIRRHSLDHPPFPVQYSVATRLTAADGTFMGTAYVYGSTLPARLVALVTRGNEQMFERMANPRPARASQRRGAVRRPAVVGASRRLPSAAYFELVRDMTHRGDGPGGAAPEGIVGKHAGDGATAFFPVDDYASPSACAAAV